MGNQAFGQILRRYREQRGWSQDVLARAAGIPQSHIAKIEAGSDVRLSTIARVTSALGLELSLEPDMRELFAHPPAGSRLAAARDFGIDLGTLYQSHRMTPAQRLAAAAGSASGLAKLLPR